jgi:hypothetical protein
LYSELDNLVVLPDRLKLVDHLGGFDKHGKNSILHKLDKKSQQAGKQLTIQYHNVLEHTITDKFKHLLIIFNADQQDTLNLSHFFKYTTHPELNFKNFVCSFNGSEHVSRKLLVSILKKFDYYNHVYVSKNCSYTIDILDGHLGDYVIDNINFYRKFFVSIDSQSFFQSINSFGHVRFQHDQNIHSLETKLTESFLHIVSETLATSYVPFVTEKFLYSVVTRGLFLAYAQPGWHAHVEKYYGFKRYTKLFDYKFDTIQNPVERLVELMTMILKFSMLSSDEWKDLYLLEQDTIEYNYNNYFSKNYLKTLKQYEI